MAFGCWRLAFRPNKTSLWWRRRSKKTAAAMAAHQSAEFRVLSTELNTNGNFGGMVIKTSYLLAKLMTFQRITRLMLLRFWRWRCCRQDCQT
jgi:hypothetical protein